MSNLVVVGVGYVGLVTGACLADRGVSVTCVDRDPDRVATVNHAQAPFHEPGLDDVLGRTVGSGLCATTVLPEAMAGADAVMIAVGTPTGPGGIDLGQVRSVCRDIGRNLRSAGDYPVVVVKSTVVPGTTAAVVVPELEHASGLEAGRDFGVAVNPEFLTEGTAVEDFEVPDRIVVGADDDRTVEVVLSLYSGFSDVRTIVTTPASAEMIKYASNTLLSTLISFSNEIADLSTVTEGVDVVDVMAGVHSSRYLSGRAGGATWDAPIQAFLRAGCGFGGSCLPKDTQALVARGGELGLDMPLLSAVLEVNRRRAGGLVDRVERAVGSLAGRRVAVLGLAFKEDTSDVRESPAIPIIRLLVETGARVVAHDPVAIPEAQRIPSMPEIAYEANLNTAVRDSDVVVVVTRWAEYSYLPDILRDLGIDPLVVDGRRMFDSTSLPRYLGIGV